MGQQTAEEEDEQPSTDRRNGITLRKGTAVTVSLALLLQLGYVVFTGGRVMEKIDTIGVEVADIKRTIYTKDAAERDISPIRRDSDRLDLRVRDLEQRVRNTPGR